MVLLPDRGDAGSVSCADRVFEAGKMAKRIRKDLEGAEVDCSEAALSIVLAKTNRDVRQRKKEAGTKRPRKKRRGSSVVLPSFQDLYRLTGEVLGRGASASVQSCRNICTDMEYAVKIIEKIPGHSGSRVVNEVEIFQRCQGHLNVIQLIIFFEDKTRFYLVCEKANGGSLLTRIHEQGTFSEKEAKEIIRDISSALTFLHSKGIAHRDLKLENILCMYPDKLNPVKICDFGLSSATELNTNLFSPASQLRSPVGTAEFMAPEVVEAYTRQLGGYDKRCDLWSLGVIMYILLCGYNPFNAKCESDCGWERGENCDACQSLLFNNILKGVYEFPEEEWSSISNEAKDIIKNLLVKNASRRLSAADILHHPWICRDPIVRKF